MTVLIVGLAVFFAIHAVQMAPAIYAATTRAAGAGGRKILVSLGSAIGLGLIVWGKAQAPIEPLWAPPAWGRYVAQSLMPVAFVLLAAAYVPSNRIGPAVRNPMLAAIILWSVGHLAANGDLASALLFGGFFVFAVVDWWSVSRRPSPARRAGSFGGDALTVVLGLLAFAGVAVAHPSLFGVAAVP